MYLLQVLEKSYSTAISKFKVNPEINPRLMLKYFRYLRLELEEHEGVITESSVCRMNTFNTFPVPKTKSDVINMLGDQSSNQFRVFQEFGPDDFVKTVAVGKKLK